ncbi:MAG: hypothetical protein PHE25_04210, partial [Candidatus Gracilibacteria bacterium]|nr:hypothetical protein [Candidatus Gracilibacteria bacterium]
GYHNDGTCYNGSNSVNCGNNGFGPQFIQGNGTTGKAMSFDGIDDWIKINDNVSLNPINITIFAKIYNNNLVYTPAGFQQNVYLWKKENTGYGLSTYQSYLNTMMCGDRGNMTGPIFIKKYNLYTISLDSLFRKKVYLDGKLLNTYQLINGINSSGNYLSIGSRNYSGLYPPFSGTSHGSVHDGSIDEVRIYNRALSDQEIQNLYNATK